MAVRIGVDVGGTFTKAVACDAQDGRLVCRSCVPTTHASPNGIAEGVIEALGHILADVEREAAGPVLLVAHSTTQAVNGLLEGDIATVGVIGIGRRPDLRQSRRRTKIGDILLAPGRILRTVHSFIDATEGLGESNIEDAIRDCTSKGAEAICVSEAFGIEDSDAERRVLDVCSRMGVAACAGHELTGLYGLQVRTITAALNASILPAAFKTAELVQQAVNEGATGVALLTMRSDGGAASISEMRHRPLLTAFSGPAASVAGALRHLSIHEGVVVEVGGTSTNVSAIQGGRPILSYIRVLDHMTCVRSIDVRVLGVGGGSLLRVGRRFGRPALIGVGPRSAHIAGLAYCCFSSAKDLVGARVELVSPRAGDPCCYVVLRAPSGATFGLTPTCAANALSDISPGSHAHGNVGAARAGFEALAHLLRRDWRELAKATLDLASMQIRQAVRQTVREHKLEDPSLVGVGGGAGVLMPAVGRAMGCEWHLAVDADVLSSVGAALSLIRVVVERPVFGPHGVGTAELIKQAEEAATQAGAAPWTLEVETQVLPERSALRAVAVGSVALEAVDGISGEQADEESLLLVAKRVLGESCYCAVRTSHYCLFTPVQEDLRQENLKQENQPRARLPQRFAIVDRRASLALKGRAVVISGSGLEVRRVVSDAVPALARRVGPVWVPPMLRMLRGARLIDFSASGDVKSLIEAASRECGLANGDPVVALISQ